MPLCSAVCLCPYVARWVCALAQLTGPPVTVELSVCVGGVKTALLSDEAIRMPLRPLQIQQKMSLNGTWASVMRSRCLTAILGVLHKRIYNYYRSK